MRSKALRIALPIGLLLWFVVPIQASALDGCVNEDLTAGSVDGHEIRYDMNTTYTNAVGYARDDWNDLGKVDIEPDTSSTYTDVDINDVNHSDVKWSGLWIKSAGADDIHINKYYTSHYSPGAIHGVIGHELGHALKLGHFDNRSYLMHCSDNRTVIVPASGDKSKYHSVWG